MTPEQILQIITDAGTPCQHRHNLSAMFVQWSRHNQEASEEDQQDIYLTYMVIVNALKQM